MIVYHILNVYKPYYVKSLGKPFGIGYNNLFHSFGKILGGVNGNTVSAVNARSLYMLHNTGDKEVRSVADSVDLYFSAHHILIYKNWIFKLLSGDYLHIFGNIAVCVSNNHILSAQNIRWTKQHRIS